jgi:hypothetical protein
LRDFEEPIDEGDSAEDYGYLSDSDIEDDGDENVSSNEQAARPNNRPFDLSDRDRTVCEGHDEPVEKGKVVKIPDMAFIT